MGQPGKIKSVMSVTGKVANPLTPRTSNYKYYQPIIETRNSQNSGNDKMGIP